MERDLKRALVTGACGGIGRAVCKNLVSLGYAVWGLDLKKEPAVEGVRYIPCDVSDEAAVKAAAKEVASAAPVLDVVVHAAGVYALNSFIEIEGEDFQEALSTNLLGAFFVNKALFPLLKSGSRVLIVTSELAAVDPLPFMGVYAVTKIALDAYAASLRAELNLLGVTVSVLRPGAVNTGMLGEANLALDRFAENTRLYPFNARKFHEIVDRAEAKSISPEKVARTVEKFAKAKRPKLTYFINKNPFLHLVSILPERFKLWLLTKMLKK